MNKYVPIHWQDVILTASKKTIQATKNNQINT